MTALLHRPINAREASGSAGLPTGLVYDKRFQDHWLHRGHPESPDRVRAITAALQDQQLIAAGRKINISRDPRPWIETVHTPEHIESLQRAHPQSHATTSLAVAGVLDAVHAVCSGELRNAFCATRPPGHHAENTGRVEGFCLYNHVAIAARYARQAFGYDRVLIVDWDYHHGNGTESAFYTDPGVLFFSTHDWYAYPGTGDPGRTGSGQGAGYNINVHLPCGTTDQMIIDAFEQRLVPAVDEFKPELILVSAGFDSRRHDLLGCYEVSDAGFIELTRIVMCLADRHCAGRLVSILEGGYNIPGTASAVVAHVKTLMENSC
ncbi:MAG: histone deacetylase [Thiotrichales bacterium]|nr:histone deacetylase [Thiotrichales bacterium]